MPSRKRSENPNISVGSLFDLIKSITGFFFPLSVSQKRFIKGLRQFGKNFFRIRKELLPHKEVVSTFSRFANL
jgi:hypothetical protein